MSPERQNIDMGHPDLLQNLNRKAQQINDHLAKMKEN